MKNFFKIALFTLVAITARADEELVDNPGCLFGQDLVDMARKIDLNFSDEMKWTADTTLTALQQEQLKVAFGVELVEEADDYGEVLLRKVDSTSNNAQYLMMLGSAGGNMVGAILEAGTARRVAVISDASIYNCTVDFENYDSLRWFYSN